MNFDEHVKRYLKFCEDFKEVLPDKSPDFPSLGMDHRRISLRRFKWLTVIQWHTAISEYMTLTGSYRVYLEDSVSKIMVRYFGDYVPLLGVVVNEFQDIKASVTDTERQESFFVSNSRDIEITHYVHYKSVVDRCKALDAQVSQHIKSLFIVFPKVKNRISVDV